MRERDGNFFGVIGDVANMAADEIGNYQKQKLDHQTAQQKLSMEQQAELRRMAIAQAQQEHSQRMDERQMGMMAEINRHNLATEAKGAGPKTLQEAWLEALNSGDTAKMDKIQRVMMQSDQFTQPPPKPKNPTNYVQKITSGADTTLAKNAYQRKQESGTIRESPTGEINPLTGKVKRGMYVTTPEMSREQAFSSSLGNYRGMIAGDRDAAGNLLSVDSVETEARKAYGMVPGGSPGKRVALGGSYLDRINRFGGVPTQTSSDLTGLTNEQLIELWKQANANTAGN